MRGGLFEDFASMRVVEIAKVRSKKLVMTKTRYEFALIRPGEVTPVANNDGKTSAEDPKLAVLMGWWTKNIKGNLKPTFAKCI